jgi:hypothetical protein
MTTNETSRGLNNQPATDRPQKSSFSSQGMSCLTLRRTASGMVEVGDTKDPDGPKPKYSSSEMAAFLLGADQHQFDGFVTPSEVEPPELAESWRLYLERNVGQPAVAQTVEMVHEPAVELSTTFGVVTA